MSWNPKLFQWHLNTRRFGREVVHLEEIDSSNRWMRHHYKQFSFSGAVVVADHQTSGRGRYDRSWFDSPGKSLLFTVLFRRFGGVDRQAMLSLLPAIAVGEFLHGQPQISGRCVELKWPNDVLINGRKISGVLGEIVSGHEEIAVQGMGINVRGERQDLPQDLRDRASTIEAETGIAIQHEVLLAEILNRMEPLYDDLVGGKMDDVRERWLKIGPRPGTPITRTESGSTVSGAFAGLGGHGELLLRDSYGELHSVISGDIEHR